MNLKCRRRDLALLLALSVATTAPSALEAQLSSAPVGVVRLPPGTEAASVLARRLHVPNGRDDGVNRVARDAFIGAGIGALTTLLIVQDCKARDRSHGDGPPCEIGYVVIGVPAVIAGAVLGAIVGDW